MFKNSITSLAVLSAIAQANQPLGIAVLSEQINNTGDWVQLLPDGEFSSVDGRPHDVLADAGWGDVVIQLEVGGTKASGRGVATDVVEASARAYLNAVNRIVRIQSRGEERDHDIGP